MLNQRHVTAAVAVGSVFTFVVSRYAAPTPPRQPQDGRRGERVTACRARLEPCREHIGIELSIGRVVAAAGTMAV